MAFSWREELGTGVKDIDDQHRELIARINNLLDACSRPTESREVGSYLRFLQEYVAFHFAAEERDMTGCAYPGLAAHEQEHEQFKRRVNDLCRQHAQQGVSISVVLKTISSSGEWLVEHIMKTDRQMAAFLVQAKKG